ncbi:MAG: ribonuclease P protein component [Bacteroidales bacterium]|nr:ribonuclease P protein component [Bacteroidales bacterium]
MAEHSSKQKLHSFSKDERLCNFTLKKILFNRGEQFGEHPFRVYWKIINPNLEEVFFGEGPVSFLGNKEMQNDLLKIQNPSFPLKKIPANAVFSSPAKCLTGVSSKVHKSAVQRNKIKRLIKEAYRNNKQSFYSFLSERNCFCIIGIIYIARPVLSYQDIEAKIVVSLQKIVQKISEQQGTCD